MFVSGCWMVCWLMFGYSVGWLNVCKVGGWGLFCRFGLIVDDLLLVGGDWLVIDWLVAAWSIGFV